MKNFLFRILLFVLTVPLFFACSTSRDFTAFSSNSGGYHGKKVTSAKAPETAQVISASEAEMPAALATETATAAEVSEPNTELSSVTSRLEQAAAEAKVQARAANKTEAKKLNLTQKLVLKKALKMAKKATLGKELKSKNPTEIAKPALDQNLKLALVFLIAALIVSILPLGGISWLVATILLIVSLVFFLLWVMTL